MSFRPSCVLPDDAVTEVTLFERVSGHFARLSDDCPLPEPLAALIQVVRQKFAPSGSHNLIKFHTESFKVSLLHYPRFFEDPHPVLEEAVVVDLGTGKMRRISYAKQSNPPILHRKETMLPLDHPKIGLFERLSSAEKKHGLYQETSRIGFKQNWEKLLRDKGIAYRGHTLVEASIEAVQPKQPQEITASRVPQRSNHEWHELTRMPP